MYAKIAQSINQLIKQYFSRREDHKKLLYAYKLYYLKKYINKIEKNSFYRWNPFYRFLYRFLNKKERYRLIIKSCNNLKRSLKKLDIDANHKKEIENLLDGYLKKYSEKKFNKKEKNITSYSSEKRLELSYEYLKKDEPEKAYYFIKNIKLFGGQEEVKNAYNILNYKNKSPFCLAIKNYLLWVSLKSGYDVSHEGIAYCYKSYLNTLENIPIEYRLNGTQECYILDYYFKHANIDAEKKQPFYTQ